jgi:hypothetical protein
MKLIKRMLIKDGSNPLLLLHNSTLEGEFSGLSHRLKKLMRMR